MAVPAMLVPAFSIWSPHPDLNRGPLPYQGSALPLSYVGIVHCYLDLPSGAGDGNRTHIISLEG